MLNLQATKDKQKEESKSKYVDIQEIEKQGGSEVDIQRVNILKKLGIKKIMLENDQSKTETDT